MSNVSAAQVFAGLDGAKVEDRNPKLPENCLSKVRITNIDLVKAQKGGLAANVSYIMEHTVLECSDPTVTIGGEYTTSISGLTGEHADLKMGKVKNALASFFDLDPKGSYGKENFWQELAVYCTESSQAARGAVVFIQTGPKSKAQNGREYIPAVFSPCEPIKL